MSQPMFETSTARMQIRSLTTLAYVFDKVSAVIGDVP